MHARILGLMAFGLIGHVSQPIVNGNDSTAAQNAVVEIQIGAALCTGTLIAPNLVLTARHCVSTISGDDCTAAPGADFALSSLAIYTGTQRPALGATPRATAKKILHDDATSICGHDLALILLDTSITDVPTRALRTDAPPVVGETFTAVGWGVTNTEQTPTVRQQRTGVKVATLSGAEFGVGESICEGDSGGPAIADADGTVIGVASRGGSVDGGCTGATNTYTSVAAFAPLIDSARTEASTATPDAGTSPTTPTTTEEKSGCSTSGSAGTPWLAIAALLFALTRRGRGR